QTGAKSSFLGRGRGGEKPDVLALRRGRRADRSAVNPGRPYGDEQPSVETGIAGFHGAKAGIVVHIHRKMIPHAAPIVSRFSDLEDVTFARASNCAQQRTYCAATHSHWPPRRA